MEAMSSWMAEISRLLRGSRVDSRSSFSVTGDWLGLFVGSDVVTSSLADFVGAVLSGMA